jgi:hypothetical protein
VTGGTAVTITGEHLADATAVQFGSQNAASYTVNSSESITAVSPPGTGMVDVTVENRSGTSAFGPADVFTYEPQLRVWSAPPRRRPLVRILSARLHGEALLLALEGTCGSCEMNLAISAIEEAGHGMPASAGDTAGAHKREPPHSVRQFAAVQAKTVTLNDTKELSLKIPLNGATRALLRARRKLTIKVQVSEGTIVVMDQTLRLPRPSSARPG